MGFLSRGPLYRRMPCLADKILLYSFLTSFDCCSLFTVIDLIDLLVFAVSRVFFVMTVSIHEQFIHITA